ncbi:MAG: hypothetical protein LBG10_07140 [Treponema sp.]|jgi:hypothetical protein|nr:hypothetical protein [Treponema sp.]
METMKKPLYTLLCRREAGFLFILLLAPLFFGACNQDPIFYNISKEVKILEPRIKGTPTNIVSFDGKIYVANRSSLYRYGPRTAEQKPVWDNPPQPGGDIRGLAATGTYLYALTGNGLKRLSAGKSWESVGIDTTDNIVRAYPYLQMIYADSKMLFAGSGNGSPNGDSSNYAILYMDESGNKLKGLKDGVHLLSGAAFNGTKHFLSTEGSGIYVFDESGTPLELIPNTEKSHITGIIAMVDNTVAAVDRSGNILKVTDTGVTSLKEDIGYKTTGALALWRSPPVPEASFNDSDDPDYPDKQAPALLLVGIQGSTSSTTQTYNNGYREIELNNDGSLPGSLTINSPGNGDPTTVSNNATYITSLGEIPINYIFQAPYAIDPNMTLFASTHGKEGLWSYRQRSEGRQWNAEE